MVPTESPNSLTPEEWEILLRSLEKKLRFRLARMGFSEIVVEEALLSSVLKILEKQASGFEIRRETLLAFQWRIAYNCAIDLQRKMRREQPVEDFAEEEHPVEFASPSANPERELI